MCTLAASPLSAERRRRPRLLVPSSSISLRGVGDDASALQAALSDEVLVFTSPAAVRFAAPAGSPMAFTVRGAVLALRTADAQEIFVERVS